jgi:hypothetical protein
MRMQYLIGCQIELQLTLEVLTNTFSYIFMYVTQVGPTTVLPVKLMYWFSSNRDKNEL